MKTISNTTARMEKWLTENAHVDGEELFYIMAVYKCVMRPPGGALRQYFLLENSLQSTTNSGFQP